MKNIIPIQNQGAELVADSRDIAKLFGVEHESLRETIEAHIEQLTRLGIFRFETGKTQSRGRPEKFSLLNFDQIAFLLTVTRATEKTKEYRLRLIVAFREARERLRPVDSILLSIPDKWKKTFRDEFYVALLRLYGDKFYASENKPSWVGWWTNRFIYEPIYDNLSTELKSKRANYCDNSGKDADWIKLHQFLEKYAKEELRDHITKITTLLQLAGSKQDFIESFAALFHGHSQLRLLLDDLRKDHP
ncbi:MAG TPA: P63C domain-containing protein [Lacunisphaera sp.]|nr:P63C domain-containing protein [Lacunisphaera sp.]